MYFIYLKMKVIIAVINTTQALVKIKLEKKKNSGLYRLYFKTAN